ncbi:MULTISPECIES: hypothetical protein [unclassified Nostoc]|uniref:hypothetical protein n=1 Tax=unclassified Nostoc TaxID=2593658 RepID=UPI0013D332C3|nr:MULTISPECIES: hypothetical protein [unclassified Nostoc]MBE9002578.1 hypothetical protein [Nostoc sp. LEGE 12447]NEU81221.1 hypothetical protein [Nostoc sp. UIC 10630]
MNEYSGLNSWIVIVSAKLPHLSQPQAKVLAMWSNGSGNDDEAANHVAHNLPPALQPTRLLSCFRRGFIKVIVALLLGQPLPFGHFFPQPWTTNLYFSSA